MTNLFLSLSLILISSPTWAADKCFTMTPTSKFDDEKCAPVKTKIQYLNCESKDATGEALNVTARFECKRKTKLLKYWHQDAMLVGEVEKKGANYEVTKTYVVGQSPSKTTTAIVPVPPLDANKASTKIESSDLAVPIKAAMNTAENDIAPPAKMPEPPPPPAQPPTDALKTEAKASEPELLNLSKIKLAATLDGYYSYNQNNPAPPATPAAYGASPATQNTHVLPNGYHDQITMNFAELRVAQAAEPAGFQLDLGFGPLVDSLAGTGVDQSSRNLLQGYFTYRAPYEIVVDAGKFFSPMGFEHIEAEGNWNYSYSLLYRYIVPVWHTGVKITAPVMKYMTASAYAVNGINTFYETNRFKTYGGQIAYDCGHLKVVGNFLTGTDTQTYSDTRNLYEANAMYVVLPYLRFAADWVLGNEIVNGGPSQNITSTAFYGQLQFLDKFYLSPRFEIFTDGAVPAAHGSGASQTITSTTASLEYRPVPKYRLMLEYRLDYSSIQAYTNSTGLTDQQAITTLAGIVSF